MAEGKSKVSEEDIIEALKQFNVPVGRNDLKAPTREFVVKVFECFLHHLDITPFQLKTWETTTHIEEPEIYEEAQFLTLLAMTVNHIFSPCNLNITVRDIVEPKPKRTKKILHFILVFWKYYLNKYSRFCAIEKTFEDEKKKAEDIVLENEILDKKYEDLVNRLQNTQPNKEVLKVLVEEKRKILDKKSIEKQNVESEYQALKTKESSLLHELSSMDIKNASLREKSAELDQLILSSPDRMTKEIQRVKDKVRVEDSKIKDKENELREAEKRVQSQETCTKDSEKIFAILNDLKEHLQSLGETAKLVVDKHQKSEDEEVKLKKLHLELKHFEDWRMHHNQESSKVFLNVKKQRETIKELLNMLQNEEIKEKKNLELIKDSINNLQQDIDNVSDNILQMNEEYKVASKEVMEKSNEYKKYINQIKNTFLEDCKEVERKTRKFQK